MSASAIDQVETNESLESLVGRVADEFLARRERGETPAVEEYAEQYPDAADLIRRTLAALNLAAGSLGGSAAAGESMPEALGDFRIIREVGRGGMGVVYEAEQLSLRRRVALKVLPFASVMDPRHLKRFHSEALAAAALDHPHVVKVYGVGQDRGVHFIALQLIDGRPLSDLIRERRGEASPVRTEELASPTKVTNPRTPGDTAYFRRVAEWGIQAAEALEHAHSLGIVHRDVKPGNLLVDGRGELFVADFGLARVGGNPGVTGTADLLGTPRYMSPEQAAARHGLVDHRSDVYSLGASLYELLALAPAFEGADRTTVLKRIGDTDPTPLRVVDAGVPRDLETVVLKCLEKDPGHRYSAAQELADDLRRFLAHEPIRARRSSLVQRARKVARRHPGVTVTVAVAVVAGLLFGVTGLTVSNRLIRREQTKTQSALDRAERERAIAQAVRDFLRNSLLLQADPRVQADALRRGGGGAAALKPDPTVRELLDRAALELAPDKIEGKFPGQPLVQAEILRTIGEAYTAIGAFDPAISHLERARDLHARELGSDDSDTMATTHSLARALLGAGKPKDAAGLLEPLCDRRRETLGPDHRDTLAAMNDLARCYYRLKEHDKALQLRKEIVDRRTATLGRDEKDTLESMNNLANSYAAIREYQKALEIHEATLTRRERVLGEDDPDTLQSMNNVGNCLAALGQYDESLRVHKKTLERRKSRLGPDDPDTLQSMNNVAVAYSALGKHKEARELHEQTLDLRQTKLPKDHRDTVQSINALAWILANCPDRTQRDPTRALALAKQAANLAPQNGDYQNTLGTAYFRVGDWKSAITALTESTKLRSGGDATDWFFLAMAHWHLGDKAQSRACYDQAVRAMDKNRQPDEDLRQFRAEAEELMGVAKP